MNMPEPITANKIRDSAKVIAELSMNSTVGALRNETSQNVGVGVQSMERGNVWGYTSMNVVVIALLCHVIVNYVQQ